jgi:hypothetical protein
VVFAPTDTSADERRTNQGFAAIREVDTSPIRRADVLALMRPSGRRASIGRR